jgi:hypothetical protein
VIAAAVGKVSGLVVAEMNPGDVAREVRRVICGRAPVVQANAFGGQLIPVYLVLSRIEEVAQRG